MAEVIDVMDIDDDDDDDNDNDNINSAKNNLKGKSVVDSAAPPDTRATPGLASGNRLPHLLLYGPPGTGKTSTVLAMARKLYGNKLQNMVLELNASDDHGIDVVRQQIQDFASTQSFSFGERLKHVIESEGLDVPENGMTALVKLSNGDMRKALNNLQSTHMACQQITEEAVYLCTGNPLPKDIEQISHWPLNEPFTISCKRISDVKTRKGLALVDIVREVTMFVFKIKMPPAVRIQLINDMADIEYRLSMACNDKLQLGSLTAAFTRARGSIVAATK
ncbi:hypothetical protein SASPL_100811 [Salvia splendens]|uniref:Replication factor C subunit 3/5 n=1 Tax=Salvia splendens TaxID=180675 RepID=A0A8X8YN21_SALSN|nr:hypothetical protein SASPL_100811 [Salvia splendens]